MRDGFSTLSAPPRCGKPSATCLPAAMSLAQYKNIDVMHKNARLPFYNFFDAAQMRRIEANSTGKAGSALSAGALTMYYEEELVKLHGMTKTVKRLYIHDPSSVSPLSKIGWILDEDIDTCMLCSALFTFNNSKSHCRACGNIFCKQCSPNFIPFAEALSLGPQRCCHLCYFGQPSIDVIPTSPTSQQPRASIDRNSPKNSPVRGGRPSASTESNPSPRCVDSGGASSNSHRSLSLSRLFGKRKSALSKLFPGMESEADDSHVARELTDSFNLPRRAHLQSQLAQNSPQQQQQQHGNNGHGSPASSVTSFHLHKPSASAPLSSSFRARDSGESPSLEGSASPPGRADRAGALVADGIVYKMNSLHIPKTRRLLLTTRPSLIYMKQSGEIKGEIPWTRDFPCTASFIDETHFEISTKARALKFYTDRGSTHGSRYWVDNINNISKNFIREF